MVVRLDARLECFSRLILLATGLAFDSCTESLDRLQSKRLWMVGLLMIATQLAGTRSTLSLRKIME